MTQLTQAQQALAARARDFAAASLDPAAAELDRGDDFPRALIADLAKQGFLGLAVPQQSALPGAGFVSHIEVLQALSRSCPAVAGIVSNHALLAYALAHWGSDAQQKQYLPALASGKKLGAIAVQEAGPVIGTGETAMIATASGEGYRLNGTKTFVRNAGAADLYLVFAAIQPDGNGLTGFIIDAKASGLTVGTRLQTMGLRACPVAHITCQNVMVDAADVIGTANCGAVIAAQLLAAGAVAEAAQTVGIAKAAVAHAADYARHRVQFHHPIASLQAIQTMLAGIVTDSHLAWLGVQEAARLIEDDAPFEAEAAMLRMFLGRFGSNMLSEAIQVEGGMGICEVVPKHIKFTLPLARMFRDIAGTTLADAPYDFPDRLIAAALA
jgi:alkylation response protein AidB-like acyl-CoA dehydrogenase